MNIDKLCDSATFTAAPKQLEVWQVYSFDEMLNQIPAFSLKGTLTIILMQEKTDA